MSRPIESGKTVLIVGGGGRETALVDSYAKSPHVERIIAVPGNDLMQMTTEKPVEIFPGVETTDVPRILDISRHESVNIVDVAQDNAVEAGVVDALEYAGIPTVGPTRAAGQIEWDKTWSREFGEKHELAQPSFKICLSQEEGLTYLDEQPDQPWFIKAAFLAQGKGALPARNKKEAIERVLEMRDFGEAGSVFLIEKWLQSEDGYAEEFSTYVFSDGKNYKLIGSAQDHKRAYNFDEGENTGGMGCSTPPLLLTPDLMAEVETNILERTLAGLQSEGRPYKGVLYLGGMVTKENGKIKPSVIEFNARWGDPEAQVLLPGLVNDLYEVSMAIAQGNIQDLQIQMDGKARVVVTGASRGYPGNYDQVKGRQIHGLEQVKEMDGVKLYGAGVKKNGEKYIANGGRLFYIVGEGDSVIEARRKAYDAMSIVSIEGNNLHFRTDIGWRDVDRLRQR